MKKLLLLPLLALLAVTGMSAQKKAADKSAKARYEVYGVAFYNLENLFDTINNNGKYDLEFSPAGARQWDGKKYWSKINNLARAITNFTTQTTPSGPAFIGVSEIENRSVLEDLVKAVDNRLISEGKRPWGLRVVHHDSPDRRGVDVGALYNPRYFKFVDVSNTTLCIPENPTFRTRDQMCVTGVMGGDTVSVIVNHWPSRRGGEAESSWLREAAAALNARIAADLLKQYPDIGIITMGDMNDDPYNKSVSQTLGAVKDMAKTEPGGLYNPFWEKLDKGIGSYIYRGGWNLFDQIIVNSNIVDGKCGLKFHAAEVLNKHFLLQQDGQYKGYPLRTFSGGAWTDGYYDHLPTEIFLVREVVK